MTEPQPAGESRRIRPKDVFERSNMPSRWERITGVAPKTAADAKYLAFVAARYKGEKRLPHPDALAVPDELGRRQRADFTSWWTSAAAIALMIIGFATDLVIVVAAGIVVVANIVVSRSTAPAISEFHARKSRCELAESRLRANPLDPQDSATINKMINCDEGTLIYCAAKIASEIEQDPAWKSPHLDIIAIDLWDELADIGESARQIAKDREATERLERGRLRDDLEVRAMIDADKQLRNEALTLLAARVHAFADYRDRVHRHGMAALRESGALSRAIRLASDEQAIDRLL
jgi:uncharacterized membrane protein YphA (DoxX/SURF4 family)